MAQLGARVNGIHEVTGSIPVWSTILRSRELTPKVSFSSASRAKDAAPKRRSREGGPAPLLNELRLGKPFLNSAAVRPLRPAARILQVIAGAQIAETDSGVAPRPPRNPVSIP